MLGVGVVCVVGGVGVWAVVCVGRGSLGSSVVGGI